SAMSSNATVASIYFNLSRPFVNRFLKIGYLRTFIDVLSHLLMILIMAVVAWTCLRLKQRGSSYHALYSTLGLFFFVGWAQILMCHSCWIARSLAGRILHAVLGALALWTGTIGICAKTMQKRRENKLFDITGRERHLSSKHSRCGLLGYLLLVACVMTGIALLCVCQGILHLCHRIFGLCGFGCLAVSQWFSYSTVFARREWNWRWIRLLQLATICTTIMVGYE
ncbi:hypothetical protein KR032_012212, partial [Drosophila birchii]